MQTEIEHFVNLAIVGQLTADQAATLIAGLIEPARGPAINNNPKHTRDTQRVLAAITAAGENGITLSQLTPKCQLIPNNERNEILQTLLKARSIVKTVEKRGFKRVSVYRVPRKYNTLPLHT